MAAESNIVLRAMGDFAGMAPKVLLRNSPRRRYCTPLHARGASWVLRARRSLHTGIQVASLLFTRVRRSMEFAELRPLWALQSCFEPPGRVAPSRSLTESSCRSTFYKNRCACNGKKKRRERRERGIGERGEPHMRLDSAWERCQKTTELAIDSQVCYRDSCMTAISRGDYT